MIFSSSAQGDLSRWIFLKLTFTQTAYQTILGRRVGIAAALHLCRIMISNFCFFSFVVRLDKFVFNTYRSSNSKERSLNFLSLNRYWRPFCVYLSNQVKDLYFTWSTAQGLLYSKQAASFFDEFFLIFQTSSQVSFVIVFYFFLFSQFLKAVDENKLLLVKSKSILCISSCKCIHGNGLFLHFSERRD